MRPTVRQANGRPSAGRAPLAASVNTGGHTSNVVDPELIEAIARRVVELLEERGEVPQRPMPTAEVARLWGRSDDWVRDHRSELGVIQGTRPLLFDPQRVREAMSSRSPGEHSRPRTKGSDKPKVASRRRRSMGIAAPLLPIRGRIKDGR